MKLHGNARTTVHMRHLMVTRLTDPAWSPTEVAHAAGVSVRTVYKWARRYRLGGVAALADASSRPHRSPRATPASAVAQMIAQRERGQCVWTIALALQYPASTVSRLLRRAGVRRPCEPRPPIQRYEWPRAGDLLHLDTKPLARIRRVGHRVHGDLARRVRGAGYEYAHVAVDDATRLAYVEVRATQRGTDCAAFLERACAWFARQGITIARLLTDNGPGYTSDAFARAVGTRRLSHRRTKPYRPQTNGKAERFIQTLLRGWAYGAVYGTSGARTAALPSWLRFYNHARPHASLGYHTPWHRFKAAA